MNLSVIYYFYVTKTLHFTFVCTLTKAAFSKTITKLMRKACVYKRVKRGAQRAPFLIKSPPNLITGAADTYRPLQGISLIYFSPSQKRRTITQCIHIPI